MSEGQQFGLWINPMIMSEDLSPVQKMVLAMIEVLDSEKGCYASNQYFAEHIGVGTATVTRAISELNRLGYISISMIKCERGTERLIKMIRGSNQNDSSPQIKMISNNISNNIDNKIDYEINRKFGKLADMVAKAYAKCPSENYSEEYVYDALHFFTTIAEEYGVKPRYTQAYIDDVVSEMLSILDNAECLDGVELDINEMKGIIEDFFLSRRNAKNGSTLTLKQFFNDKMMYPFILKYRNCETEIYYNVLRE